MPVGHVEPPGPLVPGNDGGRERAEPGGLGEGHGIAEPAAAAVLGVFAQKRNAGGEQFQGRGAVDSPADVDEPHRAVRLAVVEVNRAITFELPGTGRPNITTLGR